MDEHNDYVKRVTPANKFHMMQLSDGWTPLCNILRMSVPDKPFPRANDAEAVEGLNKEILKEAGSRWAGIFALMGALGYGTLWLWKGGIVGSALGRH